MNDYSFLRLEDTLSKALDTNPSRIATIGRFDQVQLLPSETYLQVSNNPNGIAFDGNYNVFICDLCGNELQNITSYVAINDILFDGIPQIEFEIAPTPYDFYKKPLTLKFVHTVSSAIWYSSPFVYTNYNGHKTTRFDYLTIQSALFQSIRLACYYTNPQNESQSKEYVKIDGQKVNSQVIITELESYYFNYCNGFNYRRLNRVLASPIVYVNGNRKTNRFTIEAGTPIGDTDLFSFEFDIAVNYDETFTPFYQIFEPFNFDRLIPRDNNFFILASNPASISIRFNRNIIAGVGNVRIFKDGVLFDTIPQNELTFNDNEFIFANPIIANGEYYILITEGLVTSVFGESFSINDITVWNFSILAGEYSNVNYNSEYLIN
jgi:hypothetical protein